MNIGSIVILVAVRGSFNFLMLIDCWIDSVTKIESIVILIAD